MTKTAAVSFEVRWRKNSDPTNLWSSPVGVGADGHISVPGLERVTDYTFEARAVSACGAKSAWATQTFNLPDVPVGTLTLAQLSTAAATANTQLANIASDNILSPAEKPTVERDYSVITSEQAGIDAQSDAYAVSRTAYDNAISSLTSYLNGLTTPTAWNDKSGNTTIVGTTFRANFNTVYTTRQALLNAIYAQGKAWANLSLYPGANLVINPSGAVGFSNWSQVSALLGAAADPNSPYFRFVGNTGGVTASNITVGAGVPFILSADMFTGGLTAGNFFCVAACFNSSNTYLGVQCQLSPPTGVASFTRYTSAPITTPANTAYIQVHAFLSGATNTNSAIRRIKLEIGSTATPFNDWATQFGNQLTVPGSNQQLGDQRNAPSSLTRNLGLVRSGTALTVFSTGAVNVNAHSIQLGGANIPYNAVTNAVTGLSVGGSYYIFTNDNYAGGTQTWSATTSASTANNNDTAYNAGQVTVPSSGSGGGGGGGGCVCADMWLRRGLTARDLAMRWRWWRPYILRGQEGWHFVRKRPVIVQEPCVRLTVADGSYLDCSTSTPVIVRGGERLRAPDVYGREMFTDHGWQRVIECELLPGLRDVVRTNLGQHTMLAGADPQRRLDTHNWKP